MRAGFVRRPCLRQCKAPACSSSDRGFALCASCLTLRSHSELATIVVLRVIGVLLWKLVYWPVITVISHWMGTGLVIGAAVAARTPLLFGVFLPAIGSNETSDGSAE